MLDQALVCLLSWLEPSTAETRTRIVEVDEAANRLSESEGKPVDERVSERLIAIYKATEHKRQPIPTIYD